MIGLNLKDGKFDSFCSFKIVIEMMSKFETNWSEKNFKMYCCIILHSNLTNQHRQSFNVSKFRVPISSADTQNVVVWRKRGVGNVHDNSAWLHENNLHEYAAWAEKDSCRLPPYFILKFCDNKNKAIQDCKNIMD